MDIEVSNNHFNCDCSICSSNHAFNAPKGLIDDFIKGDVVVFAGAGVSTENPLVFPFSLYEEVCSELEIEDKDVGFPELMQTFSEQHNGRLKLISAIKNRFDYVDAFPELRRMATKFHREISTFYPVQTFVTTNWDRYFEEECSATPFVTSKDLAFWDVPGRKVLKIHGSIENYGSIVATSDDYKACHDGLEKGLIGGVLKHLLATKTVVYFGYSLKDSDFLSINKYVKEQMGELARAAYLVNPYDINVEDIPESIVHIKTDATYFIQCIKKHALTELEGHMFHDAVYSFIEIVLETTRNIHHHFCKEIDFKKHPEAVLCASYQDGLIHAFERFLTSKPSGKLSHKCEISNTVRSYDEPRRKNLKAKRYELNFI